MLISLAAVMLAACADELDEPAETLSRDEAQLIFNQRNVGQIRAQLNFARSLPYRSDEQHLAASVALHARGVGQVFAQRHDVNDWVLNAANEPTASCTINTEIDCCNLVEAHEKASSGTLTTDTVVTTAHHGIDRPTPQTAEECGVMVAFEASTRVVAGATSLDDVNVGGLFIQDRYAITQAPCKGNYVAVDGWCEPPVLALDEFLVWGSVTTAEENPLLANRLFGLGLQTWAEDNLWSAPSAEVANRGVKRRRVLRRWPFKLDDWENQNRALANSSNELDRPDVAFLRACEHGNLDPFPDNGVADFQTDLLDRDGFTASSTAEYTPSGAFDNLIPAIFFDRTLLVDASTQAITTELPSHLLHTTRWPDDLGSAVPLVSNPGYFFEGSAPCTTLPACTDPTTDAWARSQYTGCTGSTLDQRPGSSGGLVVTQRRTENDERSHMFVGVATAHGGIGEGWLQQCTASEPSPTLAGQSCPNTNLVDRPAGLVTNVSATTATWGNRDINVTVAGGVVTATPAPPGQLVPLIDDGTPRCDLEPRPEGCGLFYVSDDEGNLERVPDGEEAFEEEDTPPATLEYPHESNSPAVDSGTPRQASCRFWDSANERWLPGLAVGFIGAATFAETDPGVPDAIGSFKIVCAPRTAESWHLNWRHLFFKGRGMVAGEDVTLGDATWSNGLLWAALTYFVEARGVDFADTFFVQLRPLSMQLCPPGYYMKGFVLARQGAIYTGLRKLICVPGKLDGSRPASLEIPLSTEGTNATRYDDFTITANYEPGESEPRLPFSLDQNIGDPRSQDDATDVRIECEDTDDLRMVLAGFGYLANGTGGLPAESFAIDCRDLP